MPVYKPSELKKLGIRPKKALSQNFLIDRNILEKIIQVADVSPGDLIVEIGPGPGALTEILLEKGARVIAIEKDKHLADLLSRFQTEDNRLEVICGDALEINIEELLDKKAKVVANLPYNITTFLLQKFIPLSEKIFSLTVMVQREFGKRMTAKKNSSDYSSFTLFLQAHADVTYEFTVKPTSFAPKPRVYSCVVNLKLHPHDYPEEFFTFVRKGFGQRRKMLRSSLKEEYGRESIEKALISLGLKSTSRPQELDLQEFFSLFKALDDVPKKITKTNEKK